MSSQAMVTLTTARKRSLGQGNIFRSVCQEFCPQGGLPQCMLGNPPWEQAPPEQPPQEQAPPPPGPGTPPPAEHAGRYGQWAGGTHPTGMQSCYCMVLTKVMPNSSILSAINWIILQAGRFCMSRLGWVAIVLVLGLGLVKKTIGSCTLISGQSWYLEVFTHFDIKIKRREITQCK